MRAGLGAGHRLPDATVSIRTNDPDLEILLDGALGGLVDHDAAGGDRASNEDVTITLTDAGDYSLDLDGVPAGRLATRDATLGAVIEHLNRRVLETTRNAVLVHAGAVAVEGRAVLVSAPSGSGKTTVTAALLAHGADYFTDETAVIDHATLEIRPYPKPLSVKPTGTPLFDELGVSLAGPGPWQVPPVALGRAVASPSPVALVVLPRRSTVDRLEPVSRAQGLVELAQQAFPVGPSAVERFEVLGRLAERAHFVRLWWTDPLHSARRVLEALDREA